MKKRYHISFRDRGYKGFEFQSECPINSKEFWDELAHDDYFQIGENFYRPLKDIEIYSITRIDQCFE